MSTKKTLKPFDFYDGVILELEDYDAFQTKFVDELKKFEEFVGKIKKANLSGGMGSAVPIAVSELAVAAVTPTIDDDIDDSWYYQEETPTTGPVDLPPWDGGDVVIDPVDNGGDTIVSGEDDTSNSGTTTIIEEPQSETDATVSEISEVNGNAIIDKIYDENGNLVAVSTEEDGKKVWYKVENGEAIVPTNTISNYSLQNDLEIIVDGETIKIPAGSYSADQVIYNSDGSISGLRVMTDKYKVWLSFDANGNINNINYIRNQTGVFSVKNANYDIYDMYGNKLGKFPKGNYYIYDVLYNKDGTVSAFKLSKDGEYEQWLYMNGNTADGNYSLYTKIQNNGTTSVSMFEQNKSLFGLLGVLFVGLGVAVVARKKLKNKNYESDDEYDGEYSDNTSGEWQEETVPVGNYGVYDVKTNEDGVITEARINPTDSDDEYWVKV